MSDYRVPPICEHPNSRWGDSWTPDELAAIRTYRDECGWAAREPLIKQISELHKVIAEMKAEAVRAASRPATLPPGWRIEVDGEKLRVTKPDGRVSEWYERPKTNGSGMYDLCMALSRTGGPPGAASH